MALLHCIVVCVLATTCLASHLVKRQAQFTCSQPDGMFSDSTNCARFYRCDNGKPTAMRCPRTLLFNPNTGICDWPNIVRNLNPNCQETVQADAAHAVCQNIPEGLTPGWAFKVQAPGLCNAFHTCGAGFLFAPCLFCGEGMFFDPVLRECVGLYGAASADVCGGLNFIAHKDKVFAQLDGTCWPFTNMPNPMQKLADKIASEGGYPNNQGRNNNRGGGYNTNNNPGRINIFGGKK